MKELVINASLLQGNERIKRKKAKLFAGRVILVTRKMSKALFTFEKNNKIENLPLTLGS